MEQQTQPITGRIIVTHQDPSGIVAEVNGTAMRFQDREDLFRAAVMLAERGLKAEEVHPPPAEGV